MKIEQLVKKIVNICKNNDLNKIYICGNGASGKTTLSKKIREEALKYGNVNLISTDDFLANTKMRVNAVSNWIENETKYTGRFTSSNYESYFLKNVYEIINSESVDDVTKNEILKSIIEKIVYNKEKDTLEVYYYYKPQTQ